MKKTLLFLLAITLSSFVVGQQVSRQMVIMEVGTGTWCQYCPGAALGADDLVENGQQVAVVENHNGDSYANQYSNSRNSYYAITGYPTAIFDGLLKHSGGHHTNSLYSTYLPKYNQRMAVLSDYTLSMVITNTSGNSYQADVTIKKENSATTATSFKLHFAITQSHISQNWQGQTHLNFVNRKMVPDQNGTAIDMTGIDEKTVTLTFDMDANWVFEDCEFVSFIQASNKEVLQGIKRGAVDLTVDFDVDTTIVNTHIPIQFTNNTFGGYIDAPETYEWSFPGGDPSTSTEKDPIVTYDSAGLYTVQLIVNRGSQIDTVSKTAFIEVQSAVGMSTLPTLLAQVYPTPASNEVKVRLSSAPAVNTTYSIMTLTGVEVMNGVFQNQEETLNVSSLSNGIYLIKIDGSTPVIKKIIIRR
ncbi:MAG: T9SS type A sorting domain-containing protein [Sphingobacteriia bacterium]|nr:T9SS type A sorting domain-containing protein [Sphingobacteriia bacterium]